MSRLSGAVAPRLARVLLSDFRSYPNLDLSIGSHMVALIGENGAGKTNILEAVSLFSLGRGMRRVEFSEMAREGGRGGFSASIQIAKNDDEVRLGIGFEPAETGGVSSRRYRIDGETVASASEFAHHLRVVWLTPAFDGLFTGPAGDRRRFLDRLVLAVDPSHGTRVNALERALRSRNRILEDDRPDPVWLDAIEREVAETGVAVAAARSETVARLSALILSGRDETSPFPWAVLDLQGVLEMELRARPAVDVEDLYREMLRDNRFRDKAAGRALIGPHASDLVVRHGPKNVLAETASTGEQKALLIGIVLAHARLVAVMGGMAPIVLLDEIAAHLDPRRRAALFGSLDDLGAQVLMTGADPHAFAELPAGSERFLVSQGRVELFA